MAAEVGTLGCERVEAAVQLASGTAAVAGVVGALPSAGSRSSERAVSASCCPAAVMADERSSAAAAAV